MQPETGPDIGSALRRAGRLLLAVSIALPASLFAGAAWHDYTTEVGQAREDLRSRVGALAEHAQTVLESINLVLARVADGVENRSWDEIRSSAEIHELLTSMQREMPQVESIFLVDPEGSIAASSRAFPMPN